MAKIWQRKNGKTWYVIVGGKRVNLETRNANVARKRAALAMEGKWPKVEEEREEAAAVAASSLHVKPEQNPAEKAEAEPSPQIADSPPLPNDGASEESAAAAAAVSAAVPSGDGAPEGPPEPDEEAKRAEWRAKFASMFGDAAASGVTGGMSAGQAVAFGTVGVLAEIVGRVGARMKPPRYMTFVLGPNDWRMTMLAMGWDEQIRRWGMNLSAIEPWHAILAGTGILAATMAMTMTTTEPGKEATQAAGQS